MRSVWELGARARDKVRVAVRVAVSVTEELDLRALEEVVDEGE